MMFIEGRVFLCLNLANYTSPPQKKQIKLLLVIYIRKDHLFCIGLPPRTCLFA